MKFKHVSVSNSDDGETYVCAIDNGEDIYISKHIEHGIFSAWEKMQDHPKAERADDQVGNGLEQPFVIVESETHATTYKVFAGDKEHAEMLHKSGKSKQQYTTFVNSNIVSIFKLNEGK